MAPQRILVYGVTGSGKSTVAAQLGLPYISVDDLMWEPGWVLVPVEEQRRRVEAIVAADAWVLDTAYSAWLGLVLPRVELIVGLDLPRHVSLWRLVRRTLSRAWTRRLVCNGNVETWRNVVSPNGIVAWHFRSFAGKRRRLEQWEREGLPVVRLRSAREVERWLERVEAPTLRS